LKKYGSANLVKTLTYETEKQGIIIKSCFLRICGFTGIIHFDEDPQIKETIFPAKPPIKAVRGLWSPNKNGITEACAVAAKAETSTCPYLERA
jgi:hypothetical protein